MVVINSKYTTNALRIYENNHFWGKKIDSAICLQFYYFFYDFHKQPSVRILPDDVIRYELNVYELPQGSHLEF